VYAQNSYLFEKSRTPNFYLKKAGGGTRDADTGHTFVVRADGTVISKSQSSSWFTTSLSDLHMMPGDTVVIPEQISKTSLLKGLKDWSQVFAQFALGAAAFKSLTQ
jgi:hypothetical protein